MQGKNKRRRLPHNIIRAISKSGLCSRKQALELVMAGKVTVNGKAVLDPGHKARDTDRILVNAKPLPKKEKRYILFHKPAGYVTTRSDELGRPTVYEFLKDIKDWIFPVGRLDLESEGLLIFTNDTKFGNMLTDPRYKVKRTYEVLINGILTDTDIENIGKGIEIGRGEKTQPACVKIIKKDQKTTSIAITLSEGKNRELRRLFEALNKPVVRLLRVAYGPFLLGNIKPGHWIEIDTPPNI